MNDAKEKLRYQEHLKLSQCIDYLESVVEGLRTGSLTLRRGDDTLLLTPGSTVCVTVKAKQKMEGQSLAFQISWASTLGVRSSV